MKRVSRNAVFSVAALFFSIAAVVTVAILIHDAVRDKLGAAAVAGIMFGVVAALSLLCTACDYLRRKLTVERRVKEILWATDRISAGDFTARVEVKRPHRRFDEYDRIAENLNGMAIALARTEKLHDDFISNVSHELKTPLAIIRNYASSLRDGNLDEETRTKYAQTLENAAERLSALVANVLRLNKLENGIPAEEEIRLDEMLAECVLAFEDAIENKNIDLACELEEVSLFSSPFALETIWSNLLSNAVKFTEPNGRISLSLKSENGLATVRVEDTGCGISKETGAHIFEKFYQGDTSHAQEGNGLGLALVKKVIDLLGGEISVESEPGKGSIFTVKLKGARNVG